MASHDNYDKDVLKALQRIANSLEKIERKIVDASTFSYNDYLSINNVNREELGNFRNRPNCFTCKYEDLNLGETPCRDCDRHSHYVSKEG